MKGYQRLTPAQKLLLDNSQRALIEALGACKDPLRDSALQPWRPERWAVTRDTRGRHIEYRLGDDDNRARVIVRHDIEDDTIFLVARTANHEHSTLNELAARSAAKRGRVAVKAPDKPGSPAG